jgi:hypothetical protein
MTPKVFMLSITSVLLVFGLWMFFGALRDWKSFNKAPKRIDFIEMFGVYGRIIYLVIGFFIIVATILVLLGINNLGPFSEYLKYRN